MTKTTINEHKKAHYVRVFLKKMGFLILDNFNYSNLLFYEKNKEKGTENLFLESYFMKEERNYKRNGVEVSPSNS